MAFQDDPLIGMLGELVLLGGVCELLHGAGRSRKDVGCL
jgi:hypothetical protein